MTKHEKELYDVAKQVIRKAKIITELGYGNVHFTEYSGKEKENENYSIHENREKAWRNNV